MTPKAQAAESPELRVKSSTSGQAPFTIVASGIRSPEGPAADRMGNVFLVSRWTGLVIMVDAAGQVRELVNTRGKPQSVAMLESGDLLVADAIKRALYRITQHGQISTIADHVDGTPLLGPNDLVVGPKNVVYMTDPGVKMEAVGRVVRVDLENRRVTVLADDLLFPNGITLSEDGHFLYVAESTRHRVWRYPLLDCRRLGCRELFHQFDDHYPDGMAFDAVGNLLVTLHGAGTLMVLSPSGALLESIFTGGAGCTNCVFGGSDFQTLYVTEDDQQALLRMRWPHPGQSLFSRSLS
jgi:gluconolactonase